MTNVSPSCTTAVVSASCVLNEGKLSGPTCTGSPLSAHFSFDLQVHQALAFTCGIIVKIRPVLRY